MSSYSSSSHQHNKGNQSTVNLVLLTDSHRSVRVAVSLARALLALHVHQHHHDNNKNNNNNDNGNDDDQQQHDINPSSSSISSSSTSSSSSSSAHSNHNCPTDSNANAANVNNNNNNNNNRVPHSDHPDSEHFDPSSCTNTNITTTTAASSSTMSTATHAKVTTSTTAVTPTPSTVSTTVTATTSTKTSSSPTSSSSSSATATTNINNNNNNANDNAPHTTQLRQQTQTQTQKTTMPPSPAIHIHLHVPAPFACSLPSPRLLPAHVHVHVHSVPSSHPFLSPSPSFSSANTGKTSNTADKHNTNKHTSVHSSSSSTSATTKTKTKTKTMSFKSSIALATQVYFHPSCTLFQSPLHPHSTSSPSSSSSSSSTKGHTQQQQQQQQQQHQQPVHGIITTPGSLLAALTLSELHTPSLSSLHSHSFPSDPSLSSSVPVPVFLLSDVPHLRTAHCPSIALTSTLATHAARVVHTTARRLRAGRRPLRASQEDLAVTHVAQQRAFYSRAALRRVNAARVKISIQREENGEMEGERRRERLKPLHVLEILDCLFAAPPVTVVLPAPRALIPPCPDWPVSDAIMNSQQQPVNVRQPQQQQMQPRQRHRPHHTRTQQARRSPPRSHQGVVVDDDDTTVSASMAQTSSFFTSNAPTARLHTHGYARFRNGFHATIVRAPPVVPAMHAPAAFPAWVDTMRKGKDSDSDGQTESDRERESERIMMKTMCEKERVRQCEKRRRQGLQRGHGRGEEREKQEGHGRRRKEKQNSNCDDHNFELHNDDDDDNNNNENDDNTNSNDIATTTTITTQQQQQQQSQHDLIHSPSLAFVRQSFSIISKSNNKTHKSVKSKSFSLARLHSPSFSQNTSPRSHSFFSPRHRATTSKSKSKSFSIPPRLRDRMSVRLISTNVRPISMVCPVGHVRIGVHLSSLTAVYAPLMPSATAISAAVISSSSVEQVAAINNSLNSNSTSNRNGNRNNNNNNKSLSPSCNPLSVKKLLRSIRNTVSSSGVHAEVLISLPSSSSSSFSSFQHQLHISQPSSKFHTKVTSTSTASVNITKYVGDADMNDWVRKHVRLVDPADFVALVPSLTALVADGDPALCVHALSVHVPVVGLVLASRGVSLSGASGNGHGFDGATNSSSSSSSKPVRTFWAHLIHLYMNSSLNSYPTSNGTSRTNSDNHVYNQSSQRRSTTTSTTTATCSTPTNTHNNNNVHAFEVTLRHVLGGGCTNQVNDIAMQLKREREHSLRWHRARQRHVLRMRVNDDGMDVLGTQLGKMEEDGDGDRMCALVDNECDWLNDEIERLGDGAMVVARAVLDRVGVRPSKATRPGK